MKKFISILALVMSLVMCVSVLASCSGESTDTTAAGTEAPAKDPNKVTVTWYEGAKVLKTQEIDKGSKVESWTPEADAEELFSGWFSESSKTEPFDFTKEITEDTDIFAGFVSNKYVEDKNSYYLIGNGAGDMSKANWNHETAAANLTMVKADDNTANIYTIKVKLYAGDAFQICYGGSWEGQMGIGLIEGAEYCDGVRKSDGKTYTAADKKVAQVKDADGKVVFVGSDENNNGMEKWNAILAEGMDGEYEITFTSYPDAAERNKITFKKVGDLEAVAQTHDMYLIGSFNEWAQKDEASKMKESDDKKTWVGFLTVTDPVEFKVFNGVSSAYIPDGMDTNIKLEEAGTYAVLYTVDGDKVEYEKCEYYVVGTFADAEGKAVNFAVKEGVTPKMTADDKTATVKFEVKDVTSMADYGWMTEQKKEGVAAVKVVFGSQLGIKDWYGAGENKEDNLYLPAGETTITLTFADKTIAAK